MGQVSEMRSHGAMHAWCSLCMHGSSATFWPGAMGSKHTVQLASSSARGGGAAADDDDDEDDDAAAGAATGDSTRSMNSSPSPSSEMGPVAAAADAAAAVAALLPGILMTVRSRMAASARCERPAARSSLSSSSSRDSR